MASTFCTICTATYNREKELKKLYNSLNRQTLKKFEWIIIDDGSIDNTEKMVSNWIDETKEYKIKFLKKKNGGKHKAINLGIELAESTMFLIVDSDDFLVDNAIQIIYEKSKEIEKIKNKKWAGVAFNKCYQNNKIIGNTFKEKHIDASSIERDKYNITGDKLEVFFTEILKKNRFPEFENENFLTETILWYKIAKQGYIFRWFNDSLCVCEYLDDGLSKNINKKFKENPKGTLLYVKTSIECLGNTIKNRIKYYSFYSYVVYNFKNISKSAKELRISKIELFLYVLIRKIYIILKKEEVN